MGDSDDEVRTKLRKAGKRLLAFMRQAGLAANAEKTNFVMFNSEGGPLEVGDVLVERKKEEKLVGLWVSHDLSWEKNLREKEIKLHQRIGLLRRLSWHLPSHIMVKCISPVFTSSLTYGLELMADPFRHCDKNTSDCPVIKRLQKLMNEAIRAALRLRKTDKISERELLRRSGQLCVCDLAERALMNHAWNSVSTERRKESSELAQRLEWGQSGRVTRQSESKHVPPQTLTSTMVSKIGLAWNFMPEDIRTEKRK